ncbi:MAG: sulfite exporter TauE/SafE family protein [Phycisphaerae bacterium]|nr:sulfite exporter TauE/SafE family protein [Phycisphaerae bacterium]
MIATLTGVLAASLLGSLHCAGMCGPLAAIASSPSAPVQLTHDHAPLRRRLLAELSLATIYNLARLVAYAALGAIAGSLGRVLELGGTLVGVQRVAAIASGLVLIVAGLVVAAQWLGLSKSVFSLPAWLTSKLSRLHAAASRLPAGARAALIGLLSAALPCGWLYAFVTAAAGTAHPLDGSLVMAAFWLGTVPVMTGVGVGIRRLAAPLRRHVPIASAIVMIVAGVACVGWRSWPILSTHAAEPVCPLCHPE